MYPGFIQIHVNIHTTLQTLMKPLGFVNSFLYIPTLGGEMEAGFEYTCTGCTNDPLHLLFERHLVIYQ